jgi:branched-chain amino acid transport system permease protein/neutral amino acid transport system permease protein
LAVEATAARSETRLRDHWRAVSGVLAGPGLWAVIALFLVYSFTNERDALATGVITGAVFALGAIGITLIYGVLKFGHFAHGDSMMLSAYLAFFFLTGVIAGESQSDNVSGLPANLGDLPGATDKIWEFSFGYGLLLAMLVAAVFTALLLILLDRGVYGPLRRRHSGIVTFSIASLGLSLIIRSVMLIFWGGDPRFYSSGLRNATDLPLDIRILYDQIFIIIVAVVLMAAIYVLLYRTKLGKAMRAMADNADLARVSGIDTDRVVVWTWAVSGALVAVAGVMLGLQAQLKPELGFIIMIPLFAAAILGGIGSPHGALVGGLLIGIFQEVAVTLDLEFIRDGFPPPGYKFSIAAIVLVAILFIRPQGLFGAKQ